MFGKDLAFITWFVMLIVDSGWDSAFEYEGKTYAEMEKTEKNKISHRGKALEELRSWLLTGDD